MLHKNVLSWFQPHWSLVSCLRKLFLHQSSCTSSSLLWGCSSSRSSCVCSCLIIQAWALNATSLKSLSVTTLSRAGYLPPHPAILHHWILVSSFVAFMSFANDCLFVYLFCFKIQTPGSSLVVQWLGFSAFTAVAQVQSLVGELRSHKLCGVGKIK